MARLVVAVGAWGPALARLPTLASPLLSAGFAALRRLDAQLAFLLSTPPSVRKDLAAWHGLLAAGDGAGVSGARVFVAGALALPRLARAPERPPWAGEDDDDAVVGLVPEEAGQAAVRAAAAAVAGALPAGLAPTIESASKLANAFKAHVPVRSVPFEWMYEGLAPLDAATSLSRGKGAPFAVAALAAAAAAEVGLDVVPLTIAPPPPAGAPPASLGPRLAARVLQGAPDPDTYALTPSAGGWAWNPVAGVVDPAPAPPPAAAGARGAWASALRAAIVCHQRRGDADAVADVLCQLLALDGGASEWEQVVGE